jgi:hypothetical protein
MDEGRGRWIRGETDGREKRKVNKRNSRQTRGVADGEEE